MSKNLAALALALVLAGCAEEQKSDEPSGLEDRPATTSYFSSISDCSELADLYALSVVQAAEEERGSFAREGWLAAVGAARARMVEVDCPGL